MEKLMALFDHILEKMPDVGHVQIRLEGAELTVERGGAVPAALPVAQASAAAVSAAETAAAAAVVTAPAVKTGVPVKSPIVGTYYASPSPDAPPFVRAGQTVTKGQTLCIIEAMKMMNEIECEQDGVVAEILAGNGQLVEFGQTLFVLEPSR